MNSPPPPRLNTKLPTHSMTPSPPPPPFNHPFSKPINPPMELRPSHYESKKSSKRRTCLKAILYRSKKIITRVIGIIVEFFSLLRLGWILLCNLGVCGQWIIKVWRLSMFAIFLMPAWYHLIYTYFTAPYIKRNIRYGTKSRNYLDIFFPHDCPNATSTRHNTRRNSHAEGGCIRKHPVVVFFTGGAWTIGYKAWGTLFALGLCKNGVLVISPDYRNHPEGCVDDMCTDVNKAMEWVVANCGIWGGDEKQIYVVGQSAGAHLAALSILLNAKQYANIIEQVNIERIDESDMSSSEDESMITVRAAITRASMSHPVIETHDYTNHECHDGPVSDTYASKSMSLICWSRHVKCFIGVSGVYNLMSALEHLHKRGLPHWVMHSIFKTQTPQDLLRVSPTHIASEKWLTNNTNALNLLPSFLLIHGKTDKTIGYESSEQFAHALYEAGVHAGLRIYDNTSHTDPIIEDPLSGFNHLTLDLLAFIRPLSHHSHTHAPIVPVLTPLSSYRQLRKIARRYHRAKRESESIVKLPVSEESALAYHQFVRDMIRATGTSYGEQRDGMIESEQILHSTPVDPVKEESKPLIPIVCIHMARLFNPF